MTISNTIPRIWEWAGIYRKSITSIGVKPSLIPLQLAELCLEVNAWFQYPTELTFLEMAARIHHQLVFIHPFENGNGHFSRLIADRFLFAWKCSYQEKIKEYKARQQEIISQMSRHVKADETFHLTANMVLSLAKRAREIFESSEVEEKRQLLNFVFQNLKLEGEKLVVELREPFNLIADTARCPMGWGRLDSNQRRPKSRDLQSVVAPHTGVN